MAREKIAASNPTLPNAEQVARQVGVGAVIFNDLKNRRTRDVKFDLETILNPYGETGPYMQYTHARCASVLAAAPMPPGGEEVDYTLLSEPEERALVRKLAAYPEALTAARVTLTAAVRIVLRNGLQLLGVQTPDAM